MRTPGEIANALFRGEFVGDAESLTTQVERAVRSRDAEILEALEKKSEVMMQNGRAFKVVHFGAVWKLLGGKS